MGHSLVSSRPYPPVLDLRPTGELSKDSCSKYRLMYGIGSTYQELGKVGLVGN